MLRKLPQRGQGFRGGFLLATFLLGAVAALASDPPASPETLWKQLEPFAQPPTEFAEKFGSYRSPLTFADGTVVQSAADWARRREEIRKTWHQRLGPWPLQAGDRLVQQDLARSLRLLSAQGAQVLHGGDQLTRFRRNEHRSAPCDHPSSS